MTRIPDHELERIKREVDLVELVRAQGVELKGHGDSLLGLCPFHEDREPSLVVSPRKNLWTCKGACGTGGSVIDWVMQAEAVSFRHAVEILREGADLSPLESPPPKRSTVQRLTVPLDLEAQDHELLGQVVDYYHATLKETPEAIAYIEKRGLDDAELVDTFKLGYANRSLGLRLPDKNRKEGLRIRQRLTKLGIVRSTGHEHLNGSLVIPVFDEQGRVAELYGRKIRNDLRKGTALHLYLPGPHRGVFNLGALRSSKEIILCEALIDALTFWRHGHRNVTSAFGTNGFTDEMVEAMKAYGTTRVLIAFDRDQAGDKAAKRIAEKLGAEGISCSRVLFPRHMDANDYALKTKPAKKALGLLLRSAEHLAGPKAVATPSSPKPMNSSVMTEPEPSPSFAASPPPDDPVTTQEIPGSSAGQPAAPEISAEVSDAEVVIRLADRRWRVRGLAKNMSFDQIRVNLLVSREDHDGFHVDTLDLYSARQRGAFVKQAATELNVKPELVKKDLGQVLLKLEALQEEQINKTLEPKDRAVVLTEKQRKQAVQLLEDPKLLERILADLQACGLVGEETNKLVAYLAAVSRKLAEPLAVMVQSSSAAGKSALMNTILSLVPEEERVQYSAMTGQSLFYMGEADLKHKVLAIAEEEGAERASYALKLLQSEGELTIASTGKDPASGRLVTHEYRVEGPVAIMLTTTAIDLDEELLNRCIVLTVDEAREQTRAIHRLQREKRTLGGLLAAKKKSTVVALHCNAQRLLRPLAVVNPFACKLTFLDNQTRTRRDHDKYLSLIDTVALLHQHQRPVRTATTADGQVVEYIEVTLADIEVANRLANEVLGRSLDELPPQSRRLLELVWKMVQAKADKEELEQTEIRFSRREVIDHSGWSYDQVRVHLGRLVNLEYVIAHRGARGLTFVYELVWDGKGINGARFLVGLLDPVALDDGTTAALGGEKPDIGEPLGGHLASIWGPSGTEDSPPKRRSDRNFQPALGAEAENAYVDRPQDHGRSAALSFAAAAADRGER